MLYWSVVFLIVAMVTAILGFGGIAGSAAVISKILFVVFLIAFAVSSMMVLTDAGDGR